MSSSIKDYSELPVGRAPQAVPVPHFPDTLHAVIWRNWDVIDVKALAEVLKGSVEGITEIALSMGLSPQREIPGDELARNYMTFLRRNWQLLPYEQLCQLLGWSAAEMQFALNEDDFLWVKLGGYKPATSAVYYAKPDAETAEKAKQVAAIIKENLGDAMHAPTEPPFGFMQRFENVTATPVSAADDAFQLRMVYPYFLRYGDPLVGNGISDIPEGYLAELASSGMNAIWFQGVLNTLAPWELAPHLSQGWEERLANLNLLVERARKYGIDVVMYLNEPRAMPPSFFEEHPELVGVNETAGRAPYSPDVKALCVSTPAVQEFMANSVRHVFEQVPDLGGVFAITYSENLTNCYSREYETGGFDEFALRSSIDGEEEKVSLEQDLACPRCAQIGPEATNALVCTLLERGMRQAGSDGKFLLYAWSTPEEWFPKLIENLPASTWLLCISEWGKEFTRGDYTGKINEYSISEVGPSEQSLRQWEMGRKRGLKLAAKMQAANSFEITSLPYIPALRLVAQHLTNVTNTGIDGVMLGWSAGGSPSPNLELVGQFVKNPHIDIQEALLGVATNRFGAGAASEVVRAWNLLSDAYTEFPFDISICYNGPQPMGPANILFAEPTGLAATMVTFPYDDLDGWRGPYSVATFISQFQKVADKWGEGVDILDGLRKDHPSKALTDEWGIAEAARTFFRSSANQARFIVARNAGDKATAAEILRDEIDLSKRLFHVLENDSRIGYEASNHYFFIRIDLAEKILNCEDLLKQFS